MTQDNKIAYFAGIIDGEGTFYIGQDHRNEKCFNSRLYVVNTDKKLIDWIKNNFDGLTYSRNSIKNPHWKTRYEWISNKSQIIKLTQLIYPFLICKQKQAEIMINFRKTFDRKRGKNNPVPLDIHTKRIFYMNEIRKLNHRTSC